MSVAETKQSSLRISLRLFAVHSVLCVTIKVDRSDAAEVSDTTMMSEAEKAGNKKIKNKELRN